MTRNNQVSTDIHLALYCLLQHLYRRHITGSPGPVRIHPSRNARRISARERVPVVDPDGRRAHDALAYRIIVIDGVIGNLNRNAELRQRTVEVLAQLVIGAAMLTGRYRSSSCRYDSGSWWLPPDLRRGNPGFQSAINDEIALLRSQRQRKRRSSAAC
jgi:hypothetical protein